MLPLQNVIVQHCIDKQANIYHNLDKYVTYLP